MRTASLKVTREERSGIQYYCILVPASLSVTGKKHRRYFRTAQAAQEARSELLLCARNGGINPPLSAAQEADARAALAFLASKGCCLTLREVVEQALPLLDLPSAHMNVAALMDEFATAKSAAWSDLSKRNFRNYAGKFCSAFGEDLLGTITAPVLEEWLADTYQNAGGRAAALRTIRPAFSFAARRGYIQASPFDMMERVVVSRRDKEVDIYTPDEARRLMDAAPDECKVPFALLLFAGIRPNELRRLKWGDIREDFVHISTKAAKTAQARNVDITPTLAAWIARAGAHAPEKAIVPRDWRRKFDNTRRKAELTGRPDAARHSFASYLLASTRDENLVRLAMGHSRNSDMLFVHYRAAATKEAAAAYWKILPND